MAVYTIPIPVNRYRHHLAITLGGQPSRIDLYYHPSDRHWYINLESPAGVPVISGRRVVANTALIGSGLARFNGDIYLVGPSDDEPGEAAFRDNVFTLVYVL